MEMAGRAFLAEGTAQSAGGTVLGVAAVTEGGERDVPSQT